MSMNKIEAAWDRLEKKPLKSLSVKDLIYYESILILGFKNADLQAGLIIVFYFFSQCQMKAKFSHWLTADRVRNSL